MTKAGPSAEKTRRMMSLTNKHYRRFFEDELENHKGLFPDKDIPFMKVPVMRG